MDAYFCSFAVNVLFVLRKYYIFAIADRSSEAPVWGQDGRDAQT